ncbi:TonB-dependent receptor [soil metagenome]
MLKHLLSLGVTCFVFTFSVFAQTTVLDQRVSVHRTAATIQEVLAELAATYSLPFSYSNDLVHLQQRVDIHADQQPLREVLDDLLKNQGIRYALIGRQIVLQPERKTKEHPSITISGYVLDATSGEALAGATVGEGPSGTGTNTFGFYSLRVPAGRLHLQVRYLGYVPLPLQLAAPAKDTTITFRLRPATSELGEVAITAGKITDLEQANRLSMRSAELKQLPRLMGEADAVKALQLMPGVQAGQEGSSDLVVRGGSPDQNLILLDGVPVYNVSHLLGVFSLFNPDAIKSVDLIKGGFPAPYGGRLSSVVDVQLKEGNNQRFAGEGAVGLISSKLLLEGPIRSEKTSFLLAARRTYLDLFTAALAALSGESILSYNFFDVNAKVNHTFSPKDRVYVSVYGGQDRFADNQQYQGTGTQEEQRFAMRWGNTTGALRWNHVFGPRLFSNLTLTHSRYGFGQSSSLHLTRGDSATTRVVDYTSSIVDWGAKADFDFAASNTHSVRFGGSYTYHTFQPEAVQLRADTFSLTTDSFSRIRAQEFYLYADDRIQLSERLQAVAGLHFSGFAVQGAFFKSLQPRLSLGYTLPRGVRLRASFASMAQYLHLLSNTSTGTPTDIWAPATDKVRPQRSWQATLGAATLLAESQFELTSDLYYKEMQDVAEFRDGADFVNDFFRSGPETNFANFVAPPYETRIVSGRGWSYGSEWMLRRRQGLTTGWLGYTLAWSWRQLAGINADQRYPYTYDSRHNVSLVLNHQLTPQWSLGGSWVYRTGYVTTLPSATYKAYNEPYNSPGSSSPHVESVDYLGERNNYRMPAYHRLDLSLTHTKKKRWGERSWNVSVYNAYNRQNPYFMQLSNYTPRRLYQVSLFPILPSFSYGFSF